MDDSGLAKSMRKKHMLYRKSITRPHDINVLNHYNYNLIPDRYLRCAVNSYFVKTFWGQKKHMHFQTADIQAFATLRFVQPIENCISFYPLTSCWANIRLFGRVKCNVAYVVSLQNQQHKRFIIGNNAYLFFSEKCSNNAFCGPFY